MSSTWYARAVAGTHPIVMVLTVIYINLSIGSLNVRLARVRKEVRWMLISRQRYKRSRKCSGSVMTQRRTRSRASSPALFSHLALCDLPIVTCTDSADSVRYRGPPKPKQLPPRVSPCSALTAHTTDEIDFCNEIENPKPVASSPPYPYSPHPRTQSQTTATTLNAGLLTSIAM